MGQFAYPFMASLFDGMPILFAAIIGVLIVIVLSIVVSVANKQKFYRASTIVPCVISVVATFFICLPDLKIVTIETVIFITMVS